ncbi:MAG: transglycosylase domain-containing protein [Eubacterium sp.]|nr:transglycosylase domain-containing protein [Eubacterium sp.]
MPSRDYDELLESFMNNSPKVYSEDKDNLSAEENKVPSAYNLDTTNSRDSKPVRRGRVIEKKKSKRKKKQRDYSSPKMKVLRVLLGLIMIAGVVAVVCISVMGIYAYSVIHGDPIFDLNEQKYAQRQTSFIYAYDKNNKEVELTRLHGDENRIWVGIDDMSEYLPKAFIAIEDKRFESHHGVDWIRTTGVIVKPQNLGQGGSTLTQQLIKNLTDENQVTIARKFNEILSALNLERYYEKKDILEAYLNTIYLSQGCYGVKTAAEKYFGKDVADLNIAECACIAGITKAPTLYNPLINTAENKKRQKQVLDAMYNEGEGVITKEQYDEAINYELIFTNSKKYKGSKVSSKNKSKTNAVDSWYIDYVIETVENDLINQGYSKRKAQALIYGGGLKIYSAVDLDVQKAMENVYENRKGIWEDGAQSAMVLMDYKGRVLGIVGGLGKKNNALGFNRAVDAKRQPGSSFKPLAVYAPAFEKSLKDPDFNYYWSTLVKDAPTDTIEVDGEPWPTNEGHRYSSDNVTVQRGIANSLNTISARSLLQIGFEYSYTFLTEKFHMSSMVDQDCAAAPLATGALTNGVSVLDMTAAYQTFGNGGQYYYPYCYYKVTDFQGNTILENSPETTKEQVLSKSTAWIMNKLLQTVMTNGTGTTFKVPSVQCIGKTGTTTGSKDRYFVGGTPEYIAAVWFGYDQQRQVMQSPSPAGTLWKNVMTEVYDRKGVNKKEFPEYDGIVRKAFDPSNGLLANYASGNYGWYDKNNLPTYSKSTGTTTEKSTESVSGTNRKPNTNTGVTNPKTSSNVHLPNNANPAKPANNNE